MKINIYEHIGNIYYTLCKLCDDIYNDIYILYSIYLSQLDINCVAFNEI